MASNGSYHLLKTKLIPLWRWLNFLKLKLTPECKNYLLMIYKCFGKVCSKASTCQDQVRGTLWRYVLQRSRVVCHHHSLEMLAHIPNKKQTVLDLALHLSGHWNPWLPAMMLDHSSLWTLPPYCKRQAMSAPGRAPGIQLERGKRDYVSKEGQAHGREIYRDCWPKLMGTYELWANSCGACIGPN